MHARALRAHLLLVALLATGCPAGNSPPPLSTGPRPPTPVALEPVERRVVPREVPVFGTLYGDEEATLSNKVPGRIKRVAADVGDVVSSGAVLCELESEDFDLAVKVAKRALEAALIRLSLVHVPDETFDPDAVATVARARVQLANARSKLARLTNLDKRGQGFVAEQTLRDAETEVSVAASNLDAERVAVRALAAEAHQRQAELSLAERRAGDAAIRAPDLGRDWAVAGRYVSQGEYLKEGTSVFSVVAANPLKLRAAIAERFVGELAVGQPASIAVDAYPVRKFPGRLSRLNPSVDIVNRTVGLEILIPNDDGFLRPHMFARGAVRTREEEALLVPLEALVSFAGVTKVFAFDGAGLEGKSRERIVKAGLRFGSKVEVTGVEPSARVLVRGQTVVADGTAVIVSGSGRPDGAQR